MQTIKCNDGITTMHYRITTRRTKNGRVGVVHLLDASGREFLSKTVTANVCCTGDDAMTAYKIALRRVLNERDNIFND